MGGRDVVRDASAEGSGSRPRPKGKAQGAVEAAVFGFAVELDVFGKGELCEDGVEMMIR